MTIRELLLEGSHIIACGAESETAWLDACVLFADLANMDRGKLLAHLPDTIDSLSTQFRQTINDKFFEQCQHRASGYPIAYLRGKKEFYGRDFLVNESVLIPRPETEILIEWVLQTFAQLPADFRMFDCCTGSGCIAISLALELKTYGEASDLSEAALAVAVLNAEKHGISQFLHFHQADLLDGLPYSPATFDLITVNPPYVPEQESHGALTHGWSEPILALNGGDDGLAIIRRFLPQAKRLLKPGGYLFMEFGDGQSSEIIKLLRASGYVNSEVRSDLAGLDRIVRARRPGYYID